MDNTPFICGGIGGRKYHKSCYSLKEDGEWKFESNLTTPRAYAANGDVIINNRLLIVGGYNRTSILSTIEVVAPDTQSVTLPIMLQVDTEGSCIYH